MVQDRKGFRPDIQALRAVAVLLVLFYHLWPEMLPGGYIGVDVFFVISGFLITSLLLRELDTTGRLSLSNFYVRRARRLLPAALLTLGATLVATFVLLPVTEWRDISREVAAAALYFENWWLAAKAVDYLAIEGSASPVQHFWSLSVEEQYYFVWPLLLAGVFALARLRGASKDRFHRTCTIVMACVLAASLLYSIVTGVSGDTGAYFSTFTRIWQLAAGGLLALRSAPTRRRPSWLVAGVLGILVSALVLSGETAYPGYAALLPTLAAVLVLREGGAYADSMLSRWMGARPVQYLGDVSYSLYLWHWPLIVFAKHWLGEHLGIGPALGILAASLVLAALSKRFVEDAFRFRRGSRTTPWRVLAPAAMASLACVGLALFLGRSAGVDPGADAQVIAGGTYPGAAVMLQGGAPIPAPGKAFVPSLVNVEDDVSSAYSQGCIQNIHGVAVKTCIYGNPNAKVRIAVVGDSHAVHWFPAFEEIARHVDVQVVGISKTSCLATNVPLYHRKLTREYDECLAWTTNVVDYLNAHPFDYVVLSESPNYIVYGERGAGVQASADRLAAGMQQPWSRLHPGPKLVVLRSTPWQPTIVRECVASHGGDFTGCTGPQKEVLWDDVMSRFARLAHVPLVDFTDLFCRDGQCPAVIGNVFVYRDDNHITATYARTLAPMLAHRLGMPGADAVAKAMQALPAKQLSGLRPTLASARDDRGRAFDGRCVQSLKGDMVTACRFGAANGKPRIAIVGDSMGANLVPAFDAAAKAHGWGVETYFKDSCLFAATPVYNRRIKGLFDQCSRWNAAVLQQVQSLRPDLLVIVQSPQYSDAADHTYRQASPVLERGIASYLARLQQAGIRVAVVRYLPWMPFDVPQCLMTRGDPAQCAVARETGMRDGPLLQVARRMPKVAILDFNDAFCDARMCHPVVDGILVYRDAMQPTATFARTLGAKVAAQLSPLLDAGQITRSASVP